MPGAKKSDESPPQRRLLTSCPRRASPKGRCITTSPTNTVSLPRSWISTTKRRGGRCMTQSVSIRQIQASGAGGPAGHPGRLYGRGHRTTNLHRRTFWPGVATLARLRRALHPAQHPPATAGPYRRRHLPQHIPVEATAQPATGMINPRQHRARRSARVETQTDPQRAADRQQPYSRILCAPPNLVGDQTPVVDGGFRHLRSFRGYSRTITTWYLFGHATAFRLAQHYR